MFNGLGTKTQRKQYTKVQVPGINEQLEQLSCAELSGHLSQCLVPRGNLQNLLQCAASDDAATRAHGHPSLFAARAQDVPGTWNRKYRVQQLSGLARLLQQLSTNTKI